MKTLQIIKIGGNVIDNPKQLDLFLKDFSGLPGLKILVHGGGKKASSFSQAIGITPKMVQGRRITDKQTLEIVTMVYAGLLNKNVVAGLQQNQCNAIGLTGADGNLIQAHKRPVKDIDYGFAGDLGENAVNTLLIENLLEQGLCPVICAITHDKKGQLLNTNADTIATQIAKAMAKHYKTQLTFCFEKKGVLKNPHDDESVIQEIDWEKYQQYKSENIITEGMIPKLDNAFEAISAGVTAIMIKHANDITNTQGTRLC